MTETPELIYLIPGEDIDGAPAMVWCDDPAPSYACDPAEAVKYIRADSVDTVLSREIDALRREIEKVRGKLSGWRDRFRREYAKGGGHDSWLLYKQAEAVERAAMNFGGRDYAEVRIGLSEWAKHLRQQADESERAGGDQ